MQAKTTAKDFFLHLGGMVTLYAAAIAFINLLFKVINEALPTVADGGYYSYGYYGSSAISLPVATLIIIFPIFLLLSRLTQNIYEIDPGKKELAVRRWLTYITLFVAGLILAGDLVTVLYKFLDGQELTAAFLLKALMVLLVTGVVFKFYLDDIRDRMATPRRRLWAIIIAVIILVAIVLGFSVIGSPLTQRLLRYDNTKIGDLQNIQWQIINHWQRKGALPNQLSDLSDSLSDFTLPKDPQSSEPYEYKKLNNTSFELCAEFNKPSREAKKNGVLSTPVEHRNENWMHQMGHHCFNRTIDPALYPVTKDVLPIRY